MKITQLLLRLVERLGWVGLGQGIWTK